MNEVATSTGPSLHRLEDRWLLASVQTVLLGLEVKEAPTAIGLDWAFLLRQASLQALGPVLGRYCENRANEVPLGILDQFRQEQANVRAYNFFLLQELGRLTRELAGAELQAVAWKGPALAAAVYGDLGLRQCADLDLLVKPAQIDQAISLLQTLGYGEMQADTGGHTRNLERGNPKAIVELHQQVVQPYFSVPLKVEELLAGATMQSTAGGNIPVPAPEMLLLLLCVHGSKHVWERLIWVLDVVLFIQQNPELDWPRLHQLAVSCRAERMLSISLLLAESVAAGVVPAGELSHAKADAAAQRLANKALEWVFLPETNHLLVLRKYWFQISMREDAQDRWCLLRHYLRLAITPGSADREAVKLPDWLGSAYYLIRPLRLAGKMFLRR
jgi:hypothetical protein